MTVQGQVRRLTALPPAMWKPGGARPLGQAPAPSPDADAQAALADLTRQKAALMVQNADLDRTCTALQENCLSARRDVKRLQAALDAMTAREAALMQRLVRIHTLQMGLGGPLFHHLVQIVAAQHGVPVPQIVDKRPCTRNALVRAARAAAMAACVDAGASKEEVGLFFGVNARAVYTALAGGRSGNAYV